MSRTLGPTNSTRAFPIAVLVLAVGFVLSAFAGSVNASLGSDLVQQIGNTPNEALDANAPTAVSTFNMAATILYGNPSWPAGVKPKAAYAPNGVVTVWNDLNNDNIQNGMEATLFTNGAAPINPKVRDDAPGDDGALCYTVWNDNNNNGNNETGEQSAQVCPDLPSASAEVRFFDGSFDATNNACGGSEVGNVTVGILPLEGPAANPPADGATCATITVTVDGEPTSQSAGVPSGAPPASVLVQVYDGDFNTTSESCEGDEVGNASVSVSPPGAPTLNPPGASARCVTVTLSVDGDDTSKSAGLPEGVPPQPASIGARVDVYDGDFNQADDSCGGNVIGNASVGLFPASGPNVNPPMGSPRCATVTLSVNGQDTSHSAGLPPGVPPPDNTASVAFELYNGSFNSTTESCEGAVIGSVNASVLPPGVPSVVPPVGSPRCATATVTVNGMSTSQSAGLEDGVPPPGPTASVLVQFFDGTFNTTTKLCTGAETGNVSASVLPPGVPVANPPAGVTCVRATATLNGDATSVDAGVPEGLPTPPTTASVRVVFYDGNFNQTANGCDGSEVGNVTVSVLPPGAPAVNPPAEASCATVTVTIDGDSTSQSGGLPPGVPPPPPTVDAGLLIEFYAAFGQADGTPPDGSDPSGSEGIECMGSPYTTAGLVNGAPVLPTNAQNAKCARITVESDDTSVSRDVGILDPLDADGDGFTNVNEISPGPTGACVTSFEKVVNWLINERNPTDCDGDLFTNLDEFSAGTAAHDGVFHPNRSPSVTGGAGPFSVDEGDELVIAVDVRDPDLADCTNPTQSYPLFGNPLPTAERDEPDVEVTTDVPINPAPELNEAGDGIEFAPDFDTATVVPSLTFNVTLEATDHGYACGGNSGGAAALFATRTFEVTVINLSDRPVLAPIGAKAVDENELLSFTVEASDPDGDDLTLAADGLPEGADFNATSGEFAWTPAFNQSGSFQVTFNVTDEAGLVDNETITIAVANVNRAPVLDAIGNRSVAESELLTFDVNATDADGDDVTFSATGLPTNATLNATSGVFAWTPGFGEEGVFPVTFSATDGDLAANESITITVGNLNRAPVLATIGAQTVNEEDTLTFTVTATDEDGGALVLSASGLPFGATFDNTTGLFNWTTLGNQSGTVEGVTFSVTDGDLVDSEAINITVVDVTTPVLNAIGDKSVNENALLVFVVDAADADNDTLTFNATGLPGGATFNVTTRTFSWTPTFSQAGVFENVTFAVTDGTTSDTEAITITVVNVNQAPVVDDLVDQEVDENVELTFNVTASDPDGGNVTLSASGLPAGADFNTTTGVFTWTPTFNQSGVFANVNFTASDGSLTDTVSISITVVHVNRAPSNPATSSADCLTIGGNLRALCFAFTGDAVELCAPGAADPDDDDLSFAFDFGDGNASSGTDDCDTHAYASADEEGFTATVTVSDGLADVTVEFVIATYDEDADNDEDGLTNGEELSGTRNIRWGNRPTDPDSADSDGDAVVAMLPDGTEFIASNAFDFTEIQAGSDPNSIDSTPGDLDGDGVSNEVDPVPESCGPAGLLVKFYEGPDATGQRVHVTQATTAGSVQVVLLTDRNLDGDCNDAMEQVPLLTQNLPAVPPELPDVPDVPDLP